MASGLDMPALAVLLAGVLLLGSVAVLKAKRLSWPARLRASLFISGVLWLALTVPAEFFDGWAFNSSCSAYLGCINGFAGYDAFEHLFSGVAILFAILWMSDTFPRLSLLSRAQWKTILALIAYVALVSVAWELLECAHDAYRVTLLHQHLLDFRLHIDNLDQPSNLDTMGDISFNLMGGVVAIIAARFMNREALKGASPA